MLRTACRWIAAIPRRMIPPSLVWAQEYYLPQLPPIKALLCARSNLESSQSTKLLGEISSKFFKPSTPTMI